MIYPKIKIFKKRIFKFYRHIDKKYKIKTKIFIYKILYRFFINKSEKYL